jgi:hypothetical protein
MSYIVILMSFTAISRSIGYGSTNNNKLSLVGMQLYLPSVTPDEGPSQPRKPDSLFPLPLRG